MLHPTVHIIVTRMDAADSAPQQADRQPTQSANGGTTAAVGRPHAEGSVLCPTSCSSVLRTSNGRFIHHKGSHKYGAKLAVDNCANTRQPAIGDFTLSGARIAVRHVGMAFDNNRDGVRIYNRCAPDHSGKRGVRIYGHQDSVAIQDASGACRRADDLCAERQDGVRIYGGRVRVQPNHTRDGVRIYGCQKGVRIYNCRESSATHTRNIVIGGSVQDEANARQSRPAAQFNQHEGMRVHNRDGVRIYNQHDGGRIHSRDGVRIHGRHNGVRIYNQHDGVRIYNRGEVRTHGRRDGARIHSEHDGVRIHGRHDGVRIYNQDGGVRIYGRDGVRIYGRHNGVRIYNQHDGVRIYSQHDGVRIYSQHDGVRIHGQHHDRTDAIGIHSRHGGVRNHRREERVRPVSRDGVRIYGKSEGVRIHSRRTAVPMRGRTDGVRIYGRSGATSDHAASGCGRAARK